MRKSRQEYTLANRLAWNEVAPRHTAHNNRELFARFSEPGYINLRGEVLAALKRVGVTGKDVIQLCCNNGSETLSLRNMGAARCVGVDAAEEFLSHGRQLIELAGAGDQVTLIHSDVYELPDELSGSFDLVLITIGGYQCPSATRQW